MENVLKKVMYSIFNELKMDLIGFITLLKL